MGDFEYYEKDEIIGEYLRNVQSKNTGGFLTSLAETYFRADQENRALLQNAILNIAAKYPEYFNA